jgi:DNA topoisomerase-2
MTFTDKELKDISKWDIMDMLLKSIDNKNQTLLNKSNGKKRRHILLDKLSDANWAGGPNSQECTLMLFEGNSASGYSTFMLPYVQGGRDKFGIYPLKGKPLNTMQADFIQISNNTEIIGIKQALGLVEGADYTEEKAFKALRYGKVVIAADSDDDGKHIIALIILFFHIRFPSLLKRGYINILRTPIIRASRGNTRIPFLSMKKFEEWRKSNPSGWSIHYYKGLGTSEEGDVKEDMQQLDQRLINFVFDEKAADKFIMAFSKNEVDKRKEWFQRMCKEDALGIEELKKLDISLFLEEEFGTYVLANMKRCIPSMFDGLKETPRKLVYVASLEWNIGAKTYTKKKVPQLSGLIVDRAAYVHGESNANKAVLHMARDFVGSNNAPIFYPSGSFGTRVKGGQDASDPRYLFTHPHVFMRFFCHPDDQAILQYKVEEGKQVEPKCYYPPLPFSLINGVSGIATGYSTFIPNHNPLDLIAWIRAKIKGDKLPNLVPWYRGFTGRMVLQDKNSKIRLDKDIEDDIDEEEEKKGEEDGGNVLITYGHFEEKGGKVIITELPVGRWSDNYENWLKTLIQEKKISDYRTMCTAHNVYFEITGFANPSYKNLKLVKKYSLNNMNLLDGEGKPKKYEKVSDIMEDFYIYRLHIYGLRKANLIKRKEEEIERLGAKERYVYYINEGKIEIRNVKKETVIKAMEENKISNNKEIINDLYNKTKASAFSEEEREKLKIKLTKLTEELKQLQNKKTTSFWLEDLQEFEDEYLKYMKK